MYGGIAGYDFSGDLVNNTNLAEITILNHTKYVELGGIVGEVVSGNIDKCKNKANIKVTENGGDIGGLIGYAKQESSITNSCNQGNIRVERQISGPNVGGVLGSANRVTVQNCYNTGNIYSLCGWAYVGGIAGDFTGDLSNSHNSGTVQGRINDETESCWLGIGGIAGTFVGNCQKTYNTGDVIAKADSWSCVGGFMGEFLGTQLRNCYNSGNLIVEDIINDGSSWKPRVGSLFGIMRVQNEVNYENFYNTGNTTIYSSDEKVKIGGIAGELYVPEVHWGVFNEAVKMRNCYITGNMSISSNKNYTFGKFIGGVDDEDNQLDQGELTIENCYYLGNEAAKLGGEDIKCNWVNCENRTEEDMKKPDFVTLLNKDNSEEIWKKDSENINKGFPILSFQ